MRRISENAAWFERKSGAINIWTLRDRGWNFAVVAKNAHEYEISTWDETNSFGGWEPQNPFPSTTPIEEVLDATWVLAVLYARTSSLPTKETDPFYAKQEPIRKAPTQATQGAQPRNEKSPSGQDAL